MRVTTKTLMNLIYDCRLVGGPCLKGYQSAVFLILAPEVACTRTTPTCRWLAANHRVDELAQAVCLDYQLISGVNRRNARRSAEKDDVASA